MDLHKLIVFIWNYKFTSSIAIFSELIVNETM